MWRIVAVSTALLGVLVAPGCGQFAGDCSGGSLSGNTCIPYPGVHWTNDKATTHVLAFDDRPMVAGIFTKARCRIVARFPAFEARAVCRGVFSTPGHGRRMAVASFNLSGHGVVNPDCAHHWRTSPYCAKRGQLIYSGT